MTQAYWDSQFNFRAVLPDFQACLDRMELLSAALTMSFERIDYGPDCRQFVELSGTPQSVLPVFIHGGYWRALTAEMHRFVLPGISTNAVANLEYRLLPDVALDKIIEDAVNGLRTLAAHTGCRLVIIGHSAGGHLAVMSAHRLPESVVATVGISGLYDLTPLPWTFLDEEVGLTAADVVGHSPQEIWGTAPASQVLVAVGAAETSEFHRQAHVFASTHGARVFTIADAHHMTVLDALADRASALNAEIRTLVASVNAL